MLEGEHFDDPTRTPVDPQPEPLIEGTEPRPFEQPLAEALVPTHRLIEQADASQCFYGYPQPVDLSIEGDRLVFRAILERPIAAPKIACAVWRATGEGDVVDGAFDP